MGDPDIVGAPPKTDILPTDQGTVPTADLREFLPDLIKLTQAVGDIIPLLTRYVHEPHRTVYFRRGELEESLNALGVPSFLDNEKLPNLLRLVVKEASSKNPFRELSRRIDF
jgi:hypothetical protein